MTRLHIDYIPVFAWMALIFVMSSDFGSYASSSNMLCSFIDWLDAHLSAQTFERLLCFFFYAREHICSNMQYWLCSCSTRLEFP